MSFKCKGCGAAIQWKITANGKYTPVDLNGMPHWATCPKFSSFKRGKHG